ncbi:hypothetical protein [Methylobacterium sp.]|uniref:hypothetical protein n=1 Tax=Methylobacterium sp. TaxID=409 RepID=UPI0025E71FB7|nr:hypothetical protein [Methylobacterium sp.]
MSATTRYPAISGGRIAAAIAMFMACAVVAGEAKAAPAPEPQKVAEMSQNQVQPSLAVDTTEDQANCSRNRRRLWVDGEGWIVRRITTCR